MEVHILYEGEALVIVDLPEVKRVKDLQLCVRIPSKMKGEDKEPLLPKVQRLPHEDQRDLDRLQFTKEVIESAVSFKPEVPLK